MSARQVYWFALGMLSLVGIAQNAWYWSQLPEQVATHFDLNGKPDAWMSKTPAVLMMCFFQLGLPLFLLGTSTLTSWLPSSMINIPHRDYWLHPERRVSTLAFVALIMNSMAVLVSTFIMALNHLTFIANRDGAPLNSVWFALAMLVFLLCMAALIAKLYWNLRLPRDTYLDR